MTEIIIAVIGVIGVVFTSIVTGLVTYRIGAKNARASERLASAEAQKSVNEAFKLLIETFQDDRKVMREEIADMKSEVQIMSMDLVLLTTHVTRLEQELVKNGNIVPPRPSRPKATTKS